jgi:predicted nucleic acid-binding protein
MMTIEASARFNWPFAGIGNRLRTNPAEVRKLLRFRLAVENLVQSNIQFLAVPAILLVDAATLGQQVGLLTNDAVTVVLMRSHRLDKIASVDADFDRVPGITRFAPA